MKLVGLIDHTGAPEYAQNEPKLTFFSFFLILSPLVCSKLPVVEHHFHLMHCIEFQVTFHEVEKPKWPGGGP